MHKSRLAVLVIDCETDDLGREAEFWSRALGAPVKLDQASPDYIDLDTPAEEMRVLLQKVAHPSRVHLDIETDDQEAEAARLEKLGAKRIAKIKRWWVMEAPSGHRFCLVNPQRSDFEEGAKAWE